MKTILLDPNGWDFLLDSSGDIAVADNPYAIAQDVASACKLFLGELYYDTSKGVPYFQSILAQDPSAAFIIAQLEAAALTVPEVVEAQVTALFNDNRTLSGNVRVIDLTGQSHNVKF